MENSQILTLFGLAWGSNMAILVFLLNQGSKTKDCVTKLRTALSQKFPDLAELLK